MKKTWIILAVLVAFALVSPVSAFGSISFSYNGDLVVKYISSDAGYNNEFGIFLPGPPLALGKIHDITPIKVYDQTGYRCSANQQVVLYIKTPVPDDPYGPQTYRSDQAGADTFNHAIVTPEGDGSYTVAFEDSWQQLIDNDGNDVVLNVACTQDPIPTPEFPTMALPAALIVGILGVVLFIQRTKE